MNKTILLLVILAIGAVVAETPVQEDGVYVLTDSNFDEFVNSQNFILVEFYAPWCGHCKKLTPEYAAAAKTLAGQNANVVLAKVDATEQKGAAGKFEIQGFPTLKFFTGSVSNFIDYNGGRTSADIVSWLTKRTGEVSQALNSAEELNALKEKNQVVVVFYGNNSDELSTFKRVAMSFDDVAFAHVASDELRATETSRVVLHKKFDEKRNDFTGAVSDEALKTFVDANQFPTVLPFNDKAIQKVFQQAQPTIFLFSNDNEASVAAEAAFAQAAKDLKGKVVFSISKPNDGFGHYQRLAEYIGANTANAPVVQLIHASGEVQKYQFTYQTITLETLTAFVNDYTAGKLKTFLKSEEIPATNDEPVKVVVGKSFDDLVKNSTADVLVEFYAPWCGHCKTLAPIYDATAKKLLVNPNIVLAKVDATANEVPGVAIRGFPTLKLFLNGKKDSPVDFEGDRTEEGILTYLKEKTTHPWVDLEGTADAQPVDNEQPTRSDL